MTQNSQHEETDESHNVLLATGGVHLALDYASGAIPGLTGVRLVTDARGNGTNQVEVDFDFLASPYRLTVERVT